jgi:hypothetical protein
LTAIKNNADLFCALALAQKNFSNRLFCRTGLGAKDFIGVLVRPFKSDLCRPNRLAALANLANQYA